MYGSEVDSTSESDFPREGIRCKKREISLRESREASPLLPAASTAEAGLVKWSVRRSAQTPTSIPD